MADADASSSSDVASCRTMSELAVLVANSRSNSLAEELQTSNCSKTVVISATDESSQRRSKSSSVPQMRIDENGEIVVDEESLTMGQLPTGSGVTVSKVSATQKLNSTSFRKRPIKKSKSWTQAETNKFYKILSYVGTDFDVMEQYFKSRSRDEIKRKFRAEGRCCSDRVEKALLCRNPSVALRLPAKLQDAKMELKTE